MLPPIKKILYTSDLSTHSTYAFKYAISLAKSLGAQVHVLHVVEKLSDDARVTLALFMQDKDAQKAALENRRQNSEIILEEKLKEFWGSLPEDDQQLRSLVSEVEVIEGYPAETILRQAETKQFDMILIGAHAQGFSQTFLGSIAKRVLRRANIPTLVVPFKEE